MSRLTFTEVHDTGKTKVWHVHNSDHGAYLGRVKWHGAWRQYIYIVDGRDGLQSVLWSADCLAELSTFISERMAERAA